MKRKLIETYQEFAIVCDNPECDYKIENPTGDPRYETSQYIDVPCPECGANLLTRKDYEDAMRFYKAIDWLNKYFSWLTYLYPGGKRKKATFHTHNGSMEVKIDNNK